MSHEDKVYRERWIATMTSAHEEINGGRGDDRTSRALKALCRAAWNEGWHSHRRLQIDVWMEDKLHGDSGEPDAGGLSKGESDMIDPR